MWCAVMPGFVNLQESDAGFSGDPLLAIANLRAALKAHSVRDPSDSTKESALLLSKSPAEGGE